MIVLQLTELSVGAKALVTDLTSVSSLVKRRLTDLGLMEGSVIALKKLLPFGGPCTIEVNGQWIAMRRKEALHIQVKTI